MKLRPLQLRAPHIAFALMVFVGGLPAAPESSTAKPADAKNEVAGSAVLLPPPQSVFVLPRNATEGKDPFFPNATRVYTSQAPAKTKVPVAPALVADLALKGISGTTEEPLAIINTTTFTTGEENEVITKAGRIRVRCVTINMGLGTALVQIGSERRELRLQPLK